MEICNYAILTKVGKAVVVFNIVGKRSSCIIQLTINGIQLAIAPDLEGGSIRFVTQSVARKCIPLDIEIAGSTAGLNSDRMTFDSGKLGIDNAYFCSTFRNRSSDINTVLVVAVIVAAYISNGSTHDFAAVNRH